jgi:hypothetical protein
MFAIVCALMAHLHRTGASWIYGNTIDMSDVPLACT